MKRFKLFPIVLFIVLLNVCDCKKARHLKEVVLLGQENASNVTVKLEDTGLQVNDVVFLQQYDLVANSTIAIIVDNQLKEPQRYFYYIQVHSYLQEVILSKTDHPTIGQEEVGTNVGLVFANDDNVTAFLENPSDERTVTLIIALLVYEIDKTPMPGLCPDKGNSETAGLNSVTSTDTISMFYSPGKGVQGVCTSGLSQLSYELRFVYHGKNEYSPDSYFEIIQKLLVAGKALEIGEEFVGKINPKLPNHRLFARYAGTGLFFVLILRDSSNETFIPISYIPGASYGCPGLPPTPEDSHCDLIEGTPAKLIYVAIMLVGISIMIFGRGILFVRVTVYSIMICGFLVYIVHSMVPFDGPMNLAVTIGLGVVLVGYWVRLLLQCHAIYRITDFMAAIILGYSFSCLILFGSADAAFFLSTANYYLVLSAGVLLITLWYFSLLAVCGVIMMNIMVGCTFIVLTLLFIFDGNLQYAFVNNWRRIRDEDFRYAFCFPHLEVVDWLSIVLWMVIFGFGLCFQRKCECAGDIYRRSRNSTSRIFRDPESQPLIAGLINSGDSNDVFLSPRSNNRFFSSLSART